MSKASYERPYAGLRVVDLSQGIAGPYCAMLLAQYGADVVKVEPLDGDWSRLLGKRYGDHTAFSIAGNLGKRSIALDLKSDEGKAVVRRLVEDADVVLEGFRPGVAARLGFSYADVAAINPRAIYLSISGFGQTGPLASKPAMDPVLQAFTGFMMENKGYDGIPHRAGVIIIDMTTGLYCFQAVATSLYARREVGEGRYIEASLMQCSANMQVVRMMAGWLEGGSPQAGAAPSGVFRGADGGWIQIIALRDKDFRTLCGILGLDELAADPALADNAGRLAQADRVTRAVADAVATAPAAEWRDKLTAAGLQNELIQDYTEFLKHPQVEATGLVSWLRQPGLDVEVPLPNPPGVPKLQVGLAASHAPRLGEHTTAVLADIGYSPDRIADLRAAGVIGGVSV